MPIGIDMNNYDISMGTGQIRMSGGGGGLAGNVYINGNVGIGVINPTVALDVNGKISSNAEISVGGTPNAGNSGGYRLLRLTPVSGTATQITFDTSISTGTGQNYIYSDNTIMEIKSPLTYFTGGNVGIGTSSPTATLDVNGTANIRNGIIHATSIPSSSPYAIGGINFISYQVVSVGVSNGGLYEKQVNITRIGSLMYIQGVVILNTPAATTSTNITIPTGCTGTSGIRLLLNLPEFSPEFYTAPAPSIASATGIITITANSLSPNSANYTYIDMLFGLGSSQAY